MLLTWGVPPGILTRSRLFAYTDGLVLVKKLVRGLLETYYIVEHRQAKDGSLYALGIDLRCFSRCPKPFIPWRPEALGPSTIQHL